MDSPADAAIGEVVPAPSAGAAGAVTAFSFGDPTPVLDSRGLLDCLECWHSGRYYEPPITLFRRMPETMVRMPVRTTKQVDSATK